ncbi:MAG: hypothetical protein IK954_04050 [Clostridia bacterium]|nr:hypothetical protein [Clostridia bacterium]
MLKKLLATVMAVALLAGCVVGCQPAEDSDIPAASTTTESTTTSSTSRTTMSTYYAGTPDAPNMPQFGGGGSSSSTTKAPTGTTTKSPNISFEPGSNRPVYRDNQELTIYAYAGPRSGGYQWQVGGQVPEDDPVGGWNTFVTEKDFLDYKNAGFTLLFPEYDAPYNSAETFKGSVLEDYMELADQVGLDVLVYAPSLTEWTSGTAQMLTATQKHFISSAINKLKGYDSFYGLTMRDEPKDTAIDIYKAIADYINGIQPGLSTLTAMLPIYGQRYLSGTYKNYIKNFGLASGIFCYDFYPLQWNPKRGNYLKTQWYQNLEMAANTADDNDFDLGIIIQSCAFGPEGGYQKVDHARSVLTKADVGFQLYTALAYGVKTVGYFTYWQHRHDGHPHTTNRFYDAMVMYPEKNGQPAVKTDTYYAVQAANNEVKKFDHVLMNFEWQGTMALKKTDEFGILSEIASYKPLNIGSASATADAIIGHLKDSAGNDGYMIVNSVEPSKNVTSKVTVNFKGATAAIAYVKGEETTIMLQDGNYTFNLGAGEGVFVIPYIA